MSNAYFSSAELEKMLQYQGLELSDVYYHFWTNKVDPNNPVQSIDYIQLVFDNKYQLTFYSGEESDSLKIVDLDLEQEKIKVQEEFHGNIEIESYDVTNDFPWEEVQNSELIVVQLKQEGALYKNDEVLLNFGEHQIDIKLNPVEGLIAEYYEED